MKNKLLKILSLALSVSLMVATSLPNASACGGERIIRHFVSFMMSPKGTLWIDTYNAFRAKSVNTAREAQRLGELAAHKMYSEVVDFNRLSVTHVDDRGNEWEIWFSEPPIPPVDMGNGFVHCTSHLGGLCPQLSINKATGKITSWGLYK